MCRKYSAIPNIEAPGCITEAVVSALEADGCKVLFIDLRKTCKRVVDGKDCSGITDRERRLGVLMTACELVVARRFFDIECSSVVSNSACWTKNLKVLLRLGLTGIRETMPICHIAKHAGHFDDKFASNLEYCTTLRRTVGDLVSSTVMQCSVRTVYEALVDAVWPWTKDRVLLDRVRLKRLTLDVMHLMSTKSTMS